MALFQPAVLEKYLSGIDEQEIDEVWGRFSAHFHDPEIQQNIRDSKEEEYQDGFLTDLFVNVLGYTKYPASGYNLKVEQRDEKGSRKADGALLADDKVIGVIELKGTDTTDLDKVEQQAFGYKNYHRHAEYVIISNFEKLRFYIDNAVEYREFNLFELTKEEFKVLWLCLEQGNFRRGLPKKIKDASLTQNEEVTKQLYADYSAFKDAIFKSIVKHNPDYDKLQLFKKTQKLLDRFLFIFFAEDQQLLPPNSIRKIIQQWQELRDEYDMDVALYDRFKKYFGYLNTGHQGKEHEIFPYNGGLFANDDVLENITIDDDLLYKHALKLSRYDFASEVDVNILGHIFEHSLNEIEEITAELEGQKVDTSKTRRKKDGVYYTPKYITQYIVENTVGKLCEEKKAELDIIDKEYKPNRQKATKKKLLDKLEDYREWLLSLTICDPACGSGAFLNQALEFLMEEHQYLDELQAKLLKESIVYPDVEARILENNLFGVDINEESVEIAKLSLWLRTAQKGRKLTSLNNNIKCGNSLIDDPEVAGEKAFNWEEEFSTVFRQKEKQAFHVTWVTHNARTSQRMIDYKVKKGEPFWLNEELEVFITKEIAKIVKEDDLNVLAYNICEDHVHMLLVCEPVALPNIVRKLKGRSSQKLKEYLEVPKVEKFHLWAQKFDRKPVEDEEGLEVVRNYIIRNREKHNLPPNKGLQPPDFEDTSNSTDDDNSDNNGLQPIVRSGGDRGAFGYFGMCCTIDHAFRPEYTGGFDVVIGNPPYLRIQGLRENFEVESKYYEKNFTSATGRFDIYVLFIEKSSEFINDNGKVSFILPHKFMISDFGEGIRGFLADNNLLESLIHFGSEMVFEDASTYTCIIILSKSNKFVRFAQSVPDDLMNVLTFSEIDYNNLSNEKWNLKSALHEKVFDRLSKQPLKIKDVFENISQGVVSVGDDIYLMKGKIEGNIFKGFSEKVSKEIEIEADIVKPLLKGENVKKYAPIEHEYYVVYPHYEKDGKTYPFEEDDFKKNFPLAYQYFLPFKDELVDKKIRYKTNPTYWYSLHRSREISLFNHEKIITPETSLGGNMTIDYSGYFHNTQVYSLVKNDEYSMDYKYLLAILNSSLFWFFMKNTGTVLRGGYFRFKTKYLEPFPLPEPISKSEQKTFINRVDTITQITATFHKVEGQFIKLLHSKFDIEKLSRKLQNWHELTFKQFLKELKKKKVELSLDKEAEWMEYFNQQKAQADDLKSQIAQTDKEIDGMVYELYGLGEEEVRVVEGEH